MRHVASTDGVVLAVHELGGSGPLVLLAHATGFHGRVWAPLAAHLADRARCVAPDLRGHGDSTVDPGHPFHWDRFADDVLAVVDDLDPPGPILAAGHSKGGAALLLAEQRRPGTFAALYCFEPIVFPPGRGGPPGEGDEHPLAAGALRRRQVFPSRDEAFANYASKPPFASLHPDALRAYVDHGFADEPDGTVRLKCLGENEAQVYRMGGNHGAFDRLGEVRCPVTVARGALSPMSPAGIAEPIAAALPHGVLEVHDDLGHFGPLEDPARIADRVAAALGL
ncbi:MAG TPA: alpha/beta hydrolase [Acidimicrobiales bacterium]|nr:alpha/beta hydrolase [Acidimicrobiales bacterium]